MNKSEYDLFAANGTRITTYGTVAIDLNLSLRRAFKWNFTVADVKIPISGMDFLSHYGLLVDARNKSLIYTATQMSSRRYTATADELSVKIIIGESPHHQLLAEFPDFIRPPIFGKERTRHGVVHHIETTPGVTDLQQTPPSRT